ncbi:MAG: lysophospholipid acyltransferase family protein, partial [bacterium]
MNSPSKKHLSPRDRALLWLLRGGVRVNTLFPRSLFYPFYRSMGLLAYWAGLRRAVVLGNLRIAFPEKSASELRKIARACYCHFACMAGETFRFAKLDRARLEKQIEAIKGEEYFQTALNRGDGKGAIIMTGHLGNWEWGSAFLTLRGLLQSIVIKPLHNAGVEAFAREIREARGIRVVLTRGSMVGLVKTLRAGEPIGLLTDQDARRHGIFVPFFGRLASTAKGAADLALSQGVPMLLCLAVRSRKRSDQFRVIVCPP